MGSNYLSILKLEVWEWINNFIRHFIMDVIVSTVGLKLIHVNKRSHYSNQDEVEVLVLIIVTFINALTSSTLFGVSLT